MPVLGFDHLAITVDNVERSVAFYTDLLDAETLFLEEFRNNQFGVVSLIIGANRINLHPAPPRAPEHLVARRPTPGSVDLCFRWKGPIEDVIALLNSRGLPVVEGPAPRPAADGSEACSVYTRDPDGNLLEFLTTD
jgi:catechol 2,3-dioxygenase-like lactoylglutathione lyase family enzyme